MDNNLKRFQDGLELVMTGLVNMLQALKNLTSEKSETAQETAPKPESRPTQKKAAPIPVDEPAPFETPTYTLEQVRAELNALRVEKGVAVIRKLLTDIGCSSLVDVKPEQYPALMEAAHAAK